jgi:hypothetical protein
MKVFWSMVFAAALWSIHPGLLIAVIAVLMVIK